MVKWTIRMCNGQVKMAAQKMWKKKSRNNQSK